MKGRPGSATIQFLDNPFKALQETFFSKRRIMHCTVCLFNRPSRKSNITIIFYDFLCRMILYFYNGIFTYFFAESILFSILAGFTR